jgi:solute carrier family 35, member E3
MISQKTNCREKVFTNKAIFSDPRLRPNQATFAAFHFCVTACTLYACSRFGMFELKWARWVETLPLSVAMCLNVILPNLSLAFSSVIFYQIVRILLTPTVALINYLQHGTVVPFNACISLIPICLGVGLVTYSDVQRFGDSMNQSTSLVGAIFAFSGVLASSFYTVWIGSFQKKLSLNSMQLLLNAAPMSSFLLLYVIPFMDVSPEWSAIETNRYLLIALVCATRFTLRGILADSVAERTLRRPDQHLTVLHRRGCRPREQYGGRTP